MTSRAKQIREWLTAQGGGRTPGEIATGIGIANSRGFAQTIDDMRRRGWLVRERQGTRWLYKLGKRPRRKSSPEQLVERRRKRDIARARAKGTRPWSEWIESRRLAAEERRAQRATETDKRRRERAAAREAAKAAKAKPAHERGRRKPKVLTASLELTAHAETVAKQKPRRETVEEWMARTGQMPQLLALGAVSKPLGITTGHRAENEASWRNRERKAA